MADAKVKSSSRRAADDLAEQEAAESAASAKTYAGPAVADYGLSAGGDVNVRPSRAVMEQKEALMNPKESQSYWDQVNKLRTRKK